MESPGFEAAQAQRDKSLDLESQLSQRAARLWQKLCDQPTLATAESIVADDRLSQVRQPVCAVPLLVQMIEHPDLNIWSQAERLKRLAACELKLEQLRALQSQVARLALLSMLRKKWMHCDARSRMLPAPTPSMKTGCASECT